jgi:anaerobic ribonucleoside-triphosphate reductase activating protein
MACEELSLRIASPITSDSIVDGPGLRAVVWCQGCRLHCPGCHNPETWDLEGGTVVSVDSVVRELATLKGQAGLTFSGGEPMLQAWSCAQIAEWAHKERGWSVWCFSGYRYEQILEMGEAQGVFLQHIDVLVDGPFVLAERDLSLQFRGSRNQRILEKNDVA